MTKLPIDESIAASQFGRARAKPLITLLLILSMATSVFMMTAFLGIQYTLTNLLEQKSDTSGMGWAHHLETQFPEAGKLAGITKGGLFASPQKKGEMAAKAPINMVDILPINTATIIMTTLRLKIRPLTQITCMPHSWLTKNLTITAIILHPLSMKNTTILH